MLAASLSMSIMRRLPASPWTCWGRVRSAFPAETTVPIAAPARYCRPSRRTHGMRRVPPTGSRCPGGLPTGERPDARQRWRTGPRSPPVSRSRDLPAASLAAQARWSGGELSGGQVERVARAVLASWLARADLDIARPSREDVPVDEIVTPPDLAWAAPLQVKGVGPVTG